MIRLPSFAALCALAACSGSPDADAEGEGFRPPVVQARGDYMARQERRFERLDRNGDGTLGADELPQRNPERTSALDGDRDGRVSRSEYIEGNLKRFDAMDADRDGQVSSEERRVTAP